MYSPPDGLLPHSPTPRSSGDNVAPGRIAPYETVDLKEDKKIKETDKAAPSPTSPTEQEEEVLVSVND